MEEKIRALRLHLGLSMAEFGRCVGYSPTHIARLEQGQSTPKREFIDRLCEIFSVDIEYFIGDLTLEVALTNAFTDIPEGRAGTEKNTDARTEKEQKQGYDGKAPERIKALRLEHHLSQRSFANNVGVNNSLISEVESGNRELSVTAAKKIEAAFDIGYEWLLYGAESKKDYPISEKLVNWLWKNEKVRKELWSRMEKG